MSTNSILIFPGASKRSLESYLTIGDALKQLGYNVLFVAESDEIKTSVIQSGGRCMPATKNKLLTYLQLIVINCRQIPFISLPIKILELITFRLQARSIVRHTNPVAAIVCSDTRLGIEYFIATIIPAFVPQITFDSSGIHALKKAIRFQAFPHTIIQKYAACFLPQWILVKFPALGNERTLAWNCLIRTVVLIFMKVPMRCPRKGGGYACRVFVNGAEFRNIFHWYGTKKEKIIATGSPEHDCFQDFCRKYSQEDSRKLLRVGMNTCSIFLQPFLKTEGQQYLNEIASIIGMLTEQCNIKNIIIKVHPREGADAYGSLLKTSDVVQIHDRASLELNAHIIHASSVVIMRSSTVGFQTVCMRTPLITYNFKNNKAAQQTGDYFSELNASFHVDSIEGMKQLMHQFTADTEQHALQAQQKRFAPYITTDGQACERIVTEIHRIINT